MKFLELDDELKAEVKRLHDHVYLATACLHGLHSYCKSDFGVGGIPKTGGPSQCKFCKAPCMCDCHDVFVCECHPDMTWQFSEGGWFLCSPPLISHPHQLPRIPVARFDESADVAKIHGQLRLKEKSNDDHAAG